MGVFEAGRNHYRPATIRQAQDRLYGNEPTSLILLPANATKDRLGPQIETCWGKQESIAWGSTLRFEDVRYATRDIDPR
jgi:hypothetical protein